MSSINFATREITCKIVYYGPGLSGKTTNLQVIHQKIPKEKKTEMLSLATEGDRTLFFDFLPLNLGNIKGFKTKFQLYTVPGQVYYNSTRQLVLRGVDGVVFVADSQKSRHAENLDSLQNLRQNLKDYDIELDELPLVLQYNKRDMANVFTLEEMDSRLNPNLIKWIPATAHNGKGVIATLKAISREVIENFNKKQGMLHKAAASAKGEGVHDVTFSGKEGFTVAKAEPKVPKAPLPPGASPFGGFQEPASAQPAPSQPNVPPAQPAPSQPVPPAQPAPSQPVPPAQPAPSQPVPSAQPTPSQPNVPQSSPFADSTAAFAKASEETDVSPMVNASSNTNSPFEKAPEVNPISKKSSLFGDDEDDQDDDIELKPYVPKSF